MSPVVTVFGSGLPRSGSPAYGQARTLGRDLANAGWTVCTGGYGGIMEAVARGAAEAGGHTIGVTCVALRRPGPNAWIREERRTETLYDRLRVLVESADAYVALPGTTGTLLELALVWDLRHKRLAPLERPFVVIGEHWRPVMAAITPTQNGDREGAGRAEPMADRREAPVIVPDVASAVSALIPPPAKPDSD